MTPVWLYTSDGRAITCVMVQFPMPRRVLWNDRLFCWDGVKYSEESPQYAAATAVGEEEPFVAREEVPEGQRPEKLE